MLRQSSLHSPSAMGTARFAMDHAPSGCAPRQTSVKCSLSRREKERSRRGELSIRRSVFACPMTGGGAPIRQARRNLPCFHSQRQQSFEIRRLRLAVSNDVSTWVNLALCSIVSNSTSGNPARDRRTTRARPRSCGAADRAPRSFRRASNAPRLLHCLRRMRGMVQALAEDGQIDGGVFHRERLQVPDAVFQVLQRVARSQIAPKATICSELSTAITFSARWASNCERVASRRPGSRHHHWRHQL